MPARNGAPPPLPPRFRPAGGSARGGSPPFLLALAELARRLDASLDQVKFLRAALFAAAGIVLALGGALADAAIHRGVEDGVTPPVVRLVTGRGLATNADLTRYAPEQLPDIAFGLRSNGFDFVRQSFAWAEIEPAPGAFAWERYDAIVAALEGQGITPVAVLHRSPAWARAAASANAFDAPPVDPAAWERFVATVAGRYGDRVPFIQLWDLPNRPDNWGGTEPSPPGYLDLLARGSNAAHATNPNVTILLAEFDPLAGPAAPAADLEWLRTVYASGGGAFFDVVAARISGGERTPYDRRVDAGTPGLSRALLVRETMTAAGDPAKPVWATHYGWTAETGVGPGVPPADQAAWTVAGIERARAEWPWMGPMFAWGFAPGPGLGGDVPAGESLIGADGLPTALLTALGGFAASGQAETAATGFLPVDARQIRYEGNWDQQHLGLEKYRTSAETGSRLAMAFDGTGLDARVRLSRQAAPLVATLNGQPVDLDLAAFQAEDVSVRIARGLPDRRHEFTLEIAGPGAFTLGGFVVERSIPLRWPVVLLVGAGAGLLAIGLRNAIFTVAQRSGRLGRRSASEWLPELPELPGWKPSRRA